MGIRDEIGAWFPELSDTFWENAERAAAAYRDWNALINVVSRKDIDNLGINHFAHSLSILRYVTIPDGAACLDVGSGGGFPGIPLAMALPNAHFTLLDPISKKLRVAESVAATCGLSNVSVKQGRAEHLRGTYGLITGRAVMAPELFFEKTVHLIDRKRKESVVAYLTGAPTEPIEIPGVVVGVFPLMSDLPHSRYLGKVLITFKLKNL